MGRRGIAKKHSNLLVTDTARSNRESATKNIFCDYGQSNRVISVQLNQDMSRGWMVVHAKFPKISRKISQNISILTLIRNFRAVCVVGQSETRQLILTANTDS